MDSDFKTPHFVIALLIIGLFAWAFAENVGDDTMKGALIGAFNLAIGFYLGSVVGNRKATENTGAAFRAIEATARATSPEQMNVTADTVTVEEAKP
ncbi:hypothetical protein IC614_03115 [Allosphingosinicella flava]|uniref:Uncharacterized protein n=1 Tax=Allosphingosinicella flava TaxID=2771430 RepID=A0A7T2GKS5_9SPHN|nr:hypothetical protein [Sphingosinicella flava]QPQ55607.1 hypothetical protein IC614_03115 [Sphingosinicella flava]